MDIYNVKDADGEPAYKETGKIEIAAGQDGNWKKDMEELLDIDVDVKVHKVSLADLDGINITAEDMLACSFMITE